MSKLDAGLEEALPGFQRGQFGEYVAIAKLGTGANGVVYKVMKGGKLFALKVVPCGKPESVL